MAARSPAASHSAKDPLHRALHCVRAEMGQPTAWSVIMTVFGDAVVPRGGAIWTGSLIEIMALLGFNGGVVRTALSRLVADGWLESARDGRRSYHHLTAHGLDATMSAARRIYRTEPPAWNGTWDIAIAASTDPAERTDVRRTLARLGFGTVSSETLLRPVTSATPHAEVRGMLFVRGPGRDADAGPQIAARAWDLESIAASYQRLGERLGPILRAAPGASDADPANTLAARILLIHEFRRVVLRDPDLPAELLPRDWPGFSIRQSVAAAYGDLLGPSEAWLTQHARGQHGPLPQPTQALSRRFAPDEGG